MLTAPNVTLGLTVILLFYGFFFVLQWIRDRQRENHFIFDRGKAILLADVSSICLWSMHLACKPFMPVEWTILFILFLFFCVGSYIKFTHGVRIDNSGIWIAGLYHTRHLRFDEIKTIEILDGSKLDEQGDDQLVIRLNDGSHINISGWAGMDELNRVLTMKEIPIGADMRAFLRKRARYHAAGIALIFVLNLSILFFLH